MKTALFIRTFDGDLEWLKLCLRSVRHFCVGWDEIIVCSDGTGAKALEYAAEHGFQTQLDCEAGSIEDGYIAQQATKLRADKFVGEDIEVISFIDSDCLVTGTWTPESLFTDDHITYLCTPWSECPDAEKAWRWVTANLIGKDSQYEFMRRQPMTYLRDTLTRARNWLVVEKQMPLLDFLGKQMAFSEFNFLGAWAFEHEPYLYHWVDTIKETWDHLPVRQFWSHGKPDKEEAAKIVEEMLS